MKELINAIENKDKHEISLALKAYVENGKHPKSSLLKILQFLPLIVERFPEALSVQDGKKTITWHKYENIIWEIGESFRQILKSDKKLRKDEELFRKIEQISLDRSFGKGRESFTMLLGQYGGNDVIQTLIRLLSDKEVFGHAIYSLRLLKAKEAEELIRPFLASKNMRVKNEAKKYFETIKMIKQ